MNQPSPKPPLAGLALHGRRRWALVGVPVVLGLAFALVRPAWLASATPRDQAPSPGGGGIGFSLGSLGPVVDCKHPTRGRIAEVIHAPASIKAGSEVEVGAPFEGKVLELCVDEGAVVSANDVIFRLDPVEWQDKKREADLDLGRKKAALLESEAELRETEHKLSEAKKEPSAVTEARLKIRQSELAREKAQAELDNATAKLARARDMLQQGVGKQDDVDAAEAEKRVQTIAHHISEEELRLAKESLTFREHDAADSLVTCQKAYDSAVTHVDRARADVKAAEVALERATRDREKCDVRTPIAGIVTQRNVNEGSLVGRGDGATAQTTHYIVSDMAHMFAYADVEEGDVAKVKEGQQTWVRVNALGDEVRLPGKVYDIANRAQQKANEETKSFRVRIQIVKKDERLRPDMSANVDVETRVTGEDALRVPLQAVLQRAKKDVGEGGAPGEAAPAQGPGKKKERAAVAGAGGGASGSGAGRNEDRVDLVFVVNESGKVQPRVVTLGPSDGESVEIASGLDPTAWIVTGPYKTLDALKSGDTVIAKFKEEPSPSPAPAEVAGAGSGSSAQKP